MAAALPTPFHVNPDTRYQKPETRNPKLETPFNVNPGTLNLKPEIRKLKTKPCILKQIAKKKIPTVDDKGRPFVPEQVPPPPPSTLITQPEALHPKPQPESGPLRAVHLSRHKWPGGLVN